MQSGWPARVHLTKKQKTRRVSMKPTQAKTLATRVLPCPPARRERMSRLLVWCQRWYTVYSPKNLREHCEHGVSRMSDGKQRATFYKFFWKSLVSRMN